MPGGKKSRASTRKIVERVPGNGVLLEEMRSQNRATIEAVEATRMALEDKIDTRGRETEHRLTILETAVRQNSADILKNGEDIRKNSDDIRVLTERVEAPGPLDQRVSRLERHAFGEP